jgi:hypothetical protein
MSGEEELLARAETLADLDELRYAVRELIDGMQHAGADRASVTSLIAAYQALDGGLVAYNPGTIKDRTSGGGYGSDAEFLDALHDVIDQVLRWARDVTVLSERLALEAESLVGEWDDACSEFRAAHAMPVKDECDGCHDRRQAAIEAAQEHVEEVARRVKIIWRAAEVLEGVLLKLEKALALLKRVPADLGEVYELVYAFVARGGKMPVYGRWVEGAGRLCAAR